MIAALLLLGGCGVGSGRPKPADHPGDSPAVDSDSAVDSPDSGPIDADADGYGADVDCDDSDPAVHPDATDICNGADDDCDGAIDEDAPQWHADADGDGYGGPDGTQACESPPDTIADGSDCDDADAATHPDALDWCGDGVDQDCDGSDECAPSVTASAAGMVVLGDDPGHAIGYGQIGAGDVNGDGLGDVVIGAPALYDPFLAGHAYILSSPVADESIVTAADAVLGCGDAPSPACGWGVAPVGDADGDGIGDVVVGMLSGVEVDTAALLYLGPVSGGLSVSSAATVWTTPIGDQFGGDVVGGDMNGDGLADVIVDDMDHPSGFAAALIYDAPLAAGLREDDADARLFSTGHAPWGDSDKLSVRGDLNDDGYADLIAAREWDATYSHDSGAVYIYLGPFSGDRQPAEADAVVYGTDEYQFLGQSADFCGDQNGDGRDDIVVGGGAIGGVYQGEGLYRRAAYVLTSPMSGAKVMPGDADGVLAGRIQEDFLGVRLEYMDDLDADGFGDIVVTAWGADSNGVDSGSAYVMFGPLLGIQDADAAASLEILGEAGDSFGAVTGSGDVDGDGVTDLLVGAPYHGTAGAVYVFKGADLVARSGR